MSISINSNYSSPISPRIFMNRVLVFALTLSLVQVTYILFFTILDFINIITWFIFYLIILPMILMLREYSFKTSGFTHINWKLIVTVLVISLTFKIIGRLDYFTVWMEYGLRESRLHGGSSVAKYSTYFSVFFYPFAIIASFLTMPKKTFSLVKVMVFIVIVLDMWLIGGRNAPIFVLLFYLLTVRSSFFEFKKIALIGLLFILIVYQFSYSTIGRVGEDFRESFNWVTLIIDTGSAEILKPDKNVLLLFSELSFFYPLIFLAHYVSHSIAELAYTIQYGEIDTVNLVYTFDQFCIITSDCIRSESLKSIESVNSRFNVYGTIFNTLLYDIGIALTGLLIFCLYLYIIGVTFYKKNIHTRNKFPIGVAFFSVILMVSGVENYTYNGIGLIPSLIVIIISIIFPIISRFSYTAKHKL